MNPACRIGLAILAAAIALVLMVGTLRSAAAQALEPQAPSEQVLSGSQPDTANSIFPNCRFGVGGNVVNYNVASLSVGWYMDWLTQFSPVRPNGAEYIQVVQLKSDLDGLSFSPPTSTLLAIVAANPGATWLISNEPDSPAQNNLLPDEYARLYHQLYYLIKQTDPAARVGAGSIVQPTPLRMQYLDRVLSSYQQLFGEWLPADLWNTHSYILREIDASDPQVCQPGQACNEPPYGLWGAFIPSGMTATRGLLYTYSQMFDQAIFRQRLIDFRTWMRNRGYGDKPLYITEYGTLFPYPPYTSDGLPYTDEHGVPMTEARTATFMTGTFNILRNLTDANVGYPADSNRLVQRWLWYSVSDAFRYGGALFDPNTHVRRPLGDVFATYVSAIPPQVDLLAVRLTADPVGIVKGNQPQTVTLRALVANSGNISMTPPMTVAFYAGYPQTGTLIGSRVITSSLAGCGTTTEVRVTWPNLTVGAHPVYFKVDGIGIVAETNKLNNVATTTVVVVPPRVYLPAVPKSFPWKP